jgi:hypothetical protein
MSFEQHAPSLQIRRTSLRKHRLQRSMPRYLLSLASIAGLLASARFAIAPPHVSGGADAAQPARQTSDPAAAAWAALFTRRYLTWSAADPQQSDQSLESFVGSWSEPDVGLVLPASGSESVEWVEVVQSREPVAGEHVYTVAVQTRPGGLQYLTVNVRRDAEGALAVVGYPAFVGPPSTTAAKAPTETRPVADSGLVTVVERALGNYLARAAGELESDLVPGAQVTLPLQPLSAISVARPSWAPGGGAVRTVARAVDAEGARVTLEYELDVSRSQGRWEISAIQTDPDD